MRRADPVEHPLVAEQVARPEAAGDDDDVRLRQVLQPRGRLEREHSVVGPYERGLVRKPCDTGVGQARQHLVGADRVERGEAIVHGDRDVHELLLSSGGESGAIGRGAYSEPAGEGASHRLGRAEAAAAGDRLGGLGRRL